MARIDATYDYLASVVGQTDTSRYDSHKKSTLRGVYNNMIKANKESPLYKIADSDSAARFAIDIKESARSIQNIVSELSESGDDLSSLLDKKVAVSSDPTVLEVEFVGDDNSVDGFDLEVLRLAQPQVNQGRFLKSDDRSFEEGSFSFDLDTTTGAYEFQFNVNRGETNIDIQSKIARLVNQSGVGLQANVITTSQGESALRIQSKQTGLAEGEDFLFKIQSGGSWNEVNTLGIGEVTSPASSSSFILNGTQRSSLSNTFTIGRSFEVTLKETNEGSAVHVGFMANTDAIGNSIGQLLGAYNSMVDVAASHGGTRNNLLYNEVTRISNRFVADFAEMGITLNDDAKFELDEETFSRAVSGEDATDHFQVLNDFKDAISKEASRTSINPMKYVDKVIVEYKNPGKSLAAPYAPSIYAGMLMNKAL